MTTAIANADPMAPPDLATPSSPRDRPAAPRSVHGLCRGCYHLPLETGHLSTLVMHAG